MASACLVFLLLSGACTVGRCAESGELDEFEQDVTKPTTTAKPGDNKEEASGLGECCLELLSELFADAIAQCSSKTVGYVGEVSHARVADARRCQLLGVTPRRVGEPSLPFAHVDLIGRNVNADIGAFDLRCEVGHGQVGLQYNQMHYRERDPADSLKITQFYGLYRMSFGSTCEVDVGAGQLQLHGNERTTRTSFTLPMLIHPQGTPFSVEFRPAWASRISDYDLALLYSRPYSSLKAGYRWVNSPNNSLSGPYAEVSLHL